MKTKVIIVAASLLALAALFLAVRPRPQAPVNTREQTPAPAATTPPVASKTFTLEIRGGQLVSGDNVLGVTQGDGVIIKASSDVADELHLHGYDKQLALPAGAPAELRFQAEVAGRFELELHGNEQVLAALEVQPK